jgi:O-methyltransferase
LNRAEKLYIELMKKSLLNLIYTDLDEEITATNEERMRRGDARRVGLDWPREAHTMIGLERLNSLQFCVEQVLQEGVTGDLIETGVWRGGASIFMRALLKAYGDQERIVWVADSFQGCPPPDPEKFPHDLGLDLSHFKELAIPRDQVEHNFARYDLLDEQVRFLEGWFKDTLLSAPIERLAVMRLDGDLYESTMDALSALYPRLSPGGYVIIDDYGAITACRLAVEDFRAGQGIVDEIVPVDWTGVYWKKSGG